VTRTIAIEAINTRIIKNTRTRGRILKQVVRMEFVKMWTAFNCRRILSGDQLL
jgi:hypothetical protein